MKSGIVTKILRKIKQEDTSTLMARFKHIVGAQAIRAYMVAKSDPILDVEVRLTQEELEHRMTKISPFYIKVTNYKQI